MAKTPLRRRPARSVTEAASATAGPVADAAPTVDAAGGEIRVRMFRQGLGDCFLVTVSRPGKSKFHLMIDCGVILGTPGKDDRLKSVVGDIIKETGDEETGGYVDVLAVTHEHYDHVAGFVCAEELFAENGVRTKGKLAVGEVWFAWTEDPTNHTAQMLREERTAHLSALTGMTQRLDRMGAAAGETADALRSTLAFFGIDPPKPDEKRPAAADKKLGDTAQAMLNARGLAPQNGVKYRRPGEVLSIADVPEIRLYVLGPPTDRASLMKTDARGEVYALALDGLAGAVQLAIGQPPDGSNEDPSAPFDAAWSYKLEDLEKSAAVDPLAEFFTTHYFGLKIPSAEADMSWRRIDGSWTASAEQLALALDGATNNTSLVLAIEIVATQDVLLFAADAQVGNWLSWQKVVFDGGIKVTTKDLLARTKFYKVGHHGSHNATLKSNGLELMTKAGLTAFIPVDHAMAVKKRWGKMPLDAIVTELGLKAKDGGSVVRIDTPLAPGQPNVTDGEPGGPFGTRWFDWTLAT